MSKSFRGIINRRENKLLNLKPNVLVRAGVESVQGVSKVDVFIILDIEEWHGGFQCRSKVEPASASAGLGGPPPPTLFRHRGGLHVSPKPSVSVVEYPGKKPSGGTPFPMKRYTLYYKNIALHSRENHAGTE